MGLEVERDRKGMSQLKSCVHQRFLVGFGLITLSFDDLLYEFVDGDCCSFRVG